MNLLSRVNRIEARLTKRENRGDSLSALVPYFTAEERATVRRILEALPDGDMTPPASDMAELLEIARKAETRRNEAS